MAMRRQIKGGDLTGFGTGAFHIPSTPTTTDDDAPTIADESLNMVGGEQGGTGDIETHPELERELVRMGERVIEREKTEAFERRQQLLGYLTKDNGVIELIEASGQTELVLSGVATLRYDIVGSEKTLHQMRDNSTGPNKIKDASVAYDNYAEPLVVESREIAPVFRGINGEWLGDGENIFIPGDNAAENVLSAVAIGEHLQKIADENNIPIRIGIAVGDFKVIVASSQDGTQKRVAVGGPVVHQAEAIESEAVVEGRPVVGFSEEAWNLVADKLKDRESVIQDEQTGTFKIEHISLNTQPATVPSRPLENLTPAEVERGIELRRAYVDPERFRQLEEAVEHNISPAREGAFITTVLIRPDNIQLAGPIIFEAADKYGASVDKIKTDGSFMLNTVNGCNEYDAARMGLEIEARLQEAHIGYHASAATSDNDRAVVSGLGSNWTVVGESVSRAQRLLDSENPGNSLIADMPTIQALKNYELDSVMLSPTHAKNTEIARGVIEKVEKIHGLAEGKQFIGLEGEQAAIRSDYELSKERGTVSYLVGNSGEGKSVLAYKALQELEAAGAPVVKVTAETYDRYQAHAVFTHLLENTMGIKGMTDGRQERAEEFLMHHVPELEDRFALLNSVLKTNFADTEKTKYLKDEQEEQERQLADITAQILESLATNGHPTSVLIEDITKADEASRRTVGYMLNVLPDRKLHLMVTGEYKTELGEPFDISNRDGVAVEGVHKIQLPKLPYITGSVEQALRNGELERWAGSEGRKWIAVLDNALGLDPSELRILSDTDNLGAQERLKYLAWVAQETQGNIGQAMEVFKWHALQSESGKGPQLWESHMSDGPVNNQFKKVYSWVGGELQTDMLESIPSIEKMIQEDVDQAPTLVRHTLNLMAVDGRITSVQLLGEMTGLSETDLHQILEEMSDWGFARRVGDRVEMPPHVQSAVYKAIAQKPEMMQKMHREWGYLRLDLDPNNTEAIVRHFRRSDDHMQALKWLDTYGTELKDQGMWSDAIQQVELAHGKIMELQANGWVTIQGQEGQRIQLSEVEIKKLIIQDAELLLESIEIALSVGRNRKHSRELMTLVEELASPYLEGDTLGLQAKQIWIKIILEKARQARWNKNGQETAESLVQQAEHEMAGIDTRSTGIDFKVDMMRGMMAQERGSIGEAQDYFRAADNAAVTLTTKLDAKNSLAKLYRNIPRYEEAEAMFSEIISLAKLHDSRGQELIAMNSLAGMLNEADRCSEAESICNQVISVSKKLGIQSRLLYARSTLGFVKRNQDDFISARKLFEETAQAFNKRGYSNVVEVLTAEEILCEIEVGNFDQAESRLLTLKEHQYGPRTLTLEALMAYQKGMSTELVNDLFQNGYSGLSGGTREDKSDLVQDALRLGELMLDKGNREDGERYLNLSKEIAREIGALTEISKVDKILSTI